MLSSLRDDCLASVTEPFAEVVASLFDVSVEDVEAEMTERDRELAAGEHVLDALAAMIAERRAEMAATEVSFEGEAYAPWSSLRYFSYEEDADDISVLVLREAGLAADGLADFFLNHLPVGPCQEILDAGQVPPYGIDLADEHHATCWRAFHIRDFADHTAARRSASIPVARQRPASQERPEWLAPRLSDRVVY